MIERSKTTQSLGSAEGKSKITNFAWTGNVSCASCESSIKYYVIICSFHLLTAKLTHSTRGLVEHKQQYKLHLDLRLREISPVAQNPYRVSCKSVKRIYYDTEACDILTLHFLKLEDTTSLHELHPPPPDTVQTQQHRELVSIKIRQVNSFSLTSLTFFRLYSFLWLYPIFSYMHYLFTFLV